VPTDLLQAPCGEAVQLGEVRDLGPLHAPEVVEALERAERPLIWAGAGARDAAREVAALAERLAAPVLTTYGARGLHAPSHPCAVGFPPHLPAVGALWDSADVVLAVGSDLDGMNTQNWAQPQPRRSSR
jgi:acetolactate synthase-1/2/3 large subunit